MPDSHRTGGPDQSVSSRCRRIPFQEAALLVLDPASAQFPVDPARLDLVEEFRRSPRGPHSDALQRLLHRMRWPGDPSEAGRYVLVVMDPGRRWGLARLPRRRGVPIEVLANTVFTSLAEAEWHVFKLRWHTLTGQDLPHTLAEPVMREPAQ